MCPPNQVQMNNNYYPKGRRIKCWSMNVQPINFIYMKGSEPGFFSICPQESMIYASHLWKETLILGNWESGKVPFHLQVEQRADILGMWTPVPLSSHSQTGYATLHRHTQQVTEPAKYSLKKTGIYSEFSEKYQNLKVLKSLSEGLWKSNL